MKFNIIKKTGSFVKDVTGMTGLRIKANAPDIMLGVGIGAICFGVYSACKATLKTEIVVEDLEHNKLEIENAEKRNEITNEDAKRMLATAYVDSAKTVAKLYAPSFLLVGGGIACAVGGQRILKKRNLALAAAYKMVDEGYSRYRQNVVDEMGEDADRRFRFGTKTSDIEYETVGDDGKTKKKKVKNAEVVANNSEGYSPYAKFFDEGCEQWVPDSPEYNLIFLRDVEAECQRKFDRRGYLLLSDVYESLGIPVTEASLVVGWLKGYGSDKISFDIYNMHRESNRDFVNGYEPVILLDFNVYGTIIDKLSNIGLGAI